jgi:hypothetical protein
MQGTKQQMMCFRLVLLLLELDIPLHAVSQPVPRMQLVVVQCVSCIPTGNPLLYAMHN